MVGSARPGPHRFYALADFASEERLYACVLPSTSVRKPVEEAGCGNHRLHSVATQTGCRRPKTLPVPRERVGGHLCWRSTATCGGQLTAIKEDP
jgi:hypothetical protein